MKTHYKPPPEQYLSKLNEESSLQKQLLKKYCHLGVKHGMTVLVHLKTLHVYISLPFTHWSNSDKSLGEIFSPISTIPPLSPHITFNLCFLNDFEPTLTKIRIYIHICICISFFRRLKSVWEGGGLGRATCLGQNVGVIPPCFSAYETLMLLIFFGSNHIIFVKCVINV